MANLTLHISLIICVLSLILLLRRKDLGLTEYHLAIFLFSLTIFLCIHPQIMVDAYGRTHYFPVSVPVALSVLAAVLLLALAALSIPVFPIQQNRLVYFSPTLLRRAKIIQSVCAVLAIASLILTVRRIGTLPLFALSQGDSSGRLMYSDVYGGFEYALGRGASRAGILLLVISYYWSNSSPIKFILNNMYLFLMGSLCFLMAIADGQRNQAVLPVIAAMVGASVLGRFKWRWGVVVLAAGLAFVVVVGQLRTIGETHERALEFSTDVPSLDSLLSWLIFYCEPSIYNLNNYNLLEQPPAWGGVWLADLLPDKIYYMIAEPKPSAIEVLQGYGQLAQPGLTFRTALADFSADFGLIGAVAVFGLIVFLNRYFLIRARNSSRWLWWYFCLAPCVFFLPFMNILVGIAFIFPILLGFFIPADMPRISARNQLDRTINLK